MSLATPAVLPPCSTGRTPASAGGSTPRRELVRGGGAEPCAGREPGAQVPAEHRASASGRRIADGAGAAVRPVPGVPPPAQEPADRRPTPTRRRPTTIVYSLTDAGRARARIYFEECSYVGTAPVPFDDYVESVAAQTIAAEQPKEDDLRRAFSDLLISEEMFGMLGPAINSGRGMFLYGYPGNGKTSIAERITPLLRHDGLDPPGHRHRGPDHQAVRPGQPRADRRRAARACSATTTTTAAGSRSAGRRSSPAAS